MVRRPYDTVLFPRIIMSIQFPRVNDADSTEKNSELRAVKTDDTSGGRGVRGDVETGNV